MISVLQRVCWNTDSWKAPSGKAFDSGNPGKHRYGTEEWNFCTDDALDGYVFGYLPWHPRENLRNEHFKIWFWTIPPSRKEWLLVGVYQDASLATENELRKLDNCFREKGIYKRRLTEALGKVDRPEQRSHIKRHIARSALGLRFKCPVGEVKILYPERVLPRVFQGKTVGARFARPTFLDRPIAISSLSATKGRSQLKCLPSPLLEAVYPRATAASLKIICPRHKALSNQFAGWLRRVGKTVVGQEQGSRGRGVQRWRILLSGGTEGLLQNEYDPRDTRGVGSAFRIQLLRLAHPSRPVVRGT